MLPFARDETLAALEGNIRMMPNVSDLLAMGMGLEQLTERLLEGVGVNDDSRGFMYARYGPCEKASLEVPPPPRLFCWLLRIARWHDAVRLAGAGLSLSFSGNHAGDPAWVWAAWVWAETR